MAIITPLRPFIPRGSTNFVSASNQYMGAANNPPATVTPLTMACWFKSDSDTAHQTCMCLDDNSGANQTLFRLAPRGDVASDPLRAIAVLIGTSGAASSATGYLPNVWHHGAGVFTAANSRTCYLDGIAGTVNTTSVVPSGITHYHIGRMAGFTTANMSGKLAHCAVWTAALDAAEIAQLAYGELPIFVRPGSLVAYHPITCPKSLYVDLAWRGFHVTPSGGPIFDPDEPPVRWRYKAFKEWMGGTAAAFDASLMAAMQPKEGFRARRHKVVAFR